MHGSMYVCMYVDGYEAASCAGVCACLYVYVFYVCVYTRTDSNEGEARHPFLCVYIHTTYAVHMYIHTYIHTYIQERKLLLLVQNARKDNKGEADAKAPAESKSPAHNSPEKKEQEKKAQEMTQQQQQQVVVCARACVFCVCVWHMTRLKRRNRRKRHRK